MKQKSLERIIDKVFDDLKEEIKRYEKLSVQVSLKNSQQSGILPTLHQHLMAQELIKSKAIIVASSTGAGKTHVGWLSYHNIEEKINRNARALIICPNSAADSAWTSQELNLYSHFLKKREQSVLRVKKISDLERATESDFVVINDDKLGKTKDPKDNWYLTKLKSLGENYFDLIILDEVHREKNKSANRTKAVDELITVINPESYLLELTATPTWNGPNDIGMLLHFVDPKTIPDPKIFDYTRDYEAASRVINRYMYRLTREELRKIIPLPDLKIRVHEVGLSDKTRKNYLALWRKQNDFFKYTWKAREILAEEKLRYLKQSELVEKIAKGELDGEGRRQVLIFTELKNKAKNLPLRLEKMYAERGFNVVRIDGSVPIGKRESIAELFRRGEAEIAIVTSQTMGQGTPLNTHHETNLPLSIVSMDEDFPPGKRCQKEGRVIRPEQTGTVFYHELRTVDEKLSQMMKDNIEMLGIKHKKNISKRMRENFDGRTLDQDINLISLFKERVNEKVLQGMKIDELEAMLASFDPNSKNSGGVLSFCVYSDLLNLIPSDTPSHLATLIASRWNGRGINYLEDLAGKPLQKLFIDMYESDYEFTSSAHTMRLIDKIVSGLERKVGKFDVTADRGSGAAYFSRITGRPSISIDIWKEMLEIGRKKCDELSEKNKALKKNKYLQRRMQDTGLMPESVDLVLDSYSLQYQAQGKDRKTGIEKKELEDAETEANRILKLGGFRISALPINLTKGSYKRYIKRQKHFGFDVADISGPYVVNEAYDIKGEKREIKSPNKIRFKGVYVIVSRKVDNSKGYLKNPNSFSLYKPKTTSLLLGMKGVWEGKEKINTGSREICTGFGMRHGRKIVSVEELVKNYAERL